MYSSHSNNSVPNLEISVIDFLFFLIVLCIEITEISLMSVCSYEILNLVLSYSDFLANDILVTSIVKFGSLCLWPGSDF